MTMATSAELEDNGQEFGEPEGDPGADPADELEDEVDDTGEPGGDEGDDAEGGGGDEDDPEKPGEPEKPVVALNGAALVEALFKDPEATASLNDAILEYQRQAALQTASQEEADAFKKLVDDGEYETIGKLIITKQQEAAARATVTESVTQEVFNPVYRKLFAQPEMQTLTAEDKASLHLSKFDNHADHVAAIQDYISTKRSKADFDTAVAKGVEEALTAEKNKGSAAKAKTASLAGRAPQTAGTVTGATSSSDLLKSGLRALIDPEGSSEDED